LLLTLALRNFAPAEDSSTNRREIMNHLVYSTYQGIDQVSIHGPVTRGRVEVLLAQQIQATKALIVDVTTADLSLLTCRDVASIANICTSLGDTELDFRLALVAGAPASFGLCRMLQLQVDQHEDRIAVRGSLGGAAQWIRSATKGQGSSKVSSIDCGAAGLNDALPVTFEKDALPSPAAA
jgi:hypothetical protein